MYAILKQGAYVQGVWIKPTLQEAESLRDTLAEEDVDDYHRWVVVSVIEGENIICADVISNVRKVMYGRYSVMVGSNLLWATTETPTLEQVSMEESKAYVHVLKDDDSYKTRSKVNSFYLVKNVK
jgi:hypothetical protein